MLCNCPTAQTSYSNRTCAERKSVDFHRSGKYMVTVAENEIKYWETESSRLIYNFKGNSYNGFANDGKVLITTTLKNDSTGVVNFWDLATGDLVDSIAAISVRISKDQNYLLVSPGTDSINVLQLKTKKKMYSLPGDIGFFINKDKQIFTAKVLADDSGYQMMFWDAKTRKLIREIKGGLAGADGNLFVIEGDSTTSILDLDKNEILQVFNRPKTKYGSGYISYKMRFSPDHKLAMFFTSDNYIAVIDNETYALKKTLEVGSTVHDVIFNEDGTMFMTVDRDSSATAWDAKTFEKRYTLKGHSQWINKLVFSNDNQLILTSSEDNTAILWNAKNGTYIRNFTGKNSTINQNILSPDGKLMAQQSGKYIFVYETATAKRTAKILCNISNFRFSNDSKYIIVNEDFQTSSSKITTIVADALTGKIIKDINYRKLNLCRVSDDGKYFALVSDSTKISVVDQDEVEIFTTSIHQTDYINSLIFSKDGQYLVVSYSSKDKENTQTTLATYHLPSKKRLWEYKNRLIYDDFTPTQNSEYLFARMAADSVFYLNLSTGQPNYIKYATKGIKWSDRRISSSADGKYMIIIDGYSIAVFDLPNRKLILEVKDESWIAYAKVTEDGKIIFSTLDDRLHQYALATGKLIAITSTKGYVTGISNGLTLTNDQTFSHLFKGTQLQYSLLAFEEDDQLVIDQFGRYDGTEAARKLLYFTCGREIISLDQVKDLLWVPNLATRIGKGEVINAQKLSDLAICGLTPQVETIDTKTDDYQFKIIPRKGGLGETVLYINNIEVKRYLPAQLTKVGSNYELKIPKSTLSGYFISNKENEVIVKAYTTKNDISSRGAKISNLKSTSNTAAPNLYAVVVGVSDYKGTELDLKYAAKDAGDIANALGFSARKLLNTDGKEHVFIYNLNTSKDAQFPEKLSIKNAIADVGKKATANDIFLIFFAGHGVMEGAKKQFYFLTADAS
jgi:WD40 repeat protein